jgi:hypothetical protein
MDIEEIRYIARQNKFAGKSTVVKQLGANVRFERDDTRRFIRDRKGGDMAEWPEDLRPPGAPAMNFWISASPGCTRRYAG